MNFPKLAPRFEGILVQEQSRHKHYQKSLCFVKCDSDGNIVYSGKEVNVYSGEDPSVRRDEPSKAVMPVMIVSVTGGFERVGDSYKVAMEGEEAYRSD